GTDGALLVDLTGPRTRATPPGPPARRSAARWRGTAPRWPPYVDRGGALARVDPDKVLAGGRASTTMLSGVTSGERPVVVAGAS
ncbi:hypothetical protein JNW89_25550, partial [Micromonospora sp. 4G55]|nr:hypothetical protein [Micromonospora sp. 4G55]